MQIRSFIADSAKEALARIRQELGSQAIVLHVRPAPGRGLSRLLSKRRVEVLAAAPAQADAASLANAFDSFRNELAELRLQFQARFSSPPVTASELTREASFGGWRIRSLLEGAGVQPLYVRGLIERLATANGSPPASVLEEIEMTRKLLRGLWTESLSSDSTASLHVFVGPPGSGKTTCLCKWLAKAVLVENRPVSVWRQDGRVANTAELLSIYGEILNVPVMRSWSGQPGMLEEEIGFVDLPGTNWRCKADVDELEQCLRQFGPAQVHLVLNAAYETRLLVEQFEAFAKLPISGLVLTHLDEQLGWGKVLELVLGTNCCVRYLTAGQNIPGGFEEISAERILTQQFAHAAVSGAGFDSGKAVATSVAFADV
jgi:flagellar biosynthesis protein FlhF